MMLRLSVSLLPTSQQHHDWESGTFDDLSATRYSNFKSIADGELVALQCEVVLPGHRILVLRTGVLHLTNLSVRYKKPRVCGVFELIDT